MPDRSRWRGPIRAAAALALGVLMLVGAGLVIGGSGAHRPRSAPLPPTGPTAAPGSATGPVPPGTAGRTTGNPAPASPTTDAGTATLAIPSLAVRAAIVPAVVAAGVLEPPRDPGQVGVWPGSAPLAGSGGTVTIAGHVNWSGMGPFAFAHLADVRPGALVLTTSATGIREVWSVVTVRARPKSSGIDPSAFAGATGARTLVLITCGGSFDASERSYEDNVYVRAVPA